MRQATVLLDLEVSCLERPVHSGDFGGAVPDAVRILCRLIAGLNEPGDRLAVAAIEAHPLHGSANQILDSARARLALRDGAGFDAERAASRLVRKLTARPPAGAHVTARIVPTPARRGERRRAPRSTRGGATS